MKKNETITTDSKSTTTGIKKHGENQINSEIMTSVPLEPFKKQITITNSNIDNLKKEDLIIKLKELDEKLKLEKEEKKKAIDIKNKEIENKEKVVFLMAGNNKKLMHELEELKREVDEKLDKVGLKQIKETERDKELKKKQYPLEQLLKVKEKELKNAINLVEIYKKDKENLEKNFKEKGDMTQYILLQDKFKHIELINNQLECEIKSLNKMKDEHQKCEDEKSQLEKEKRQLINEIKYVKEKNKVFKLKVRQEEEKLIKSNEKKDLNTIINQINNPINNPISNSIYKFTQLPNISQEKYSKILDTSDFKTQEIKKKSMPHALMKKDKEAKKHLSQERQKFSLSLQNKNFRGINSEGIVNKLFDEEERALIVSLLPQSELLKLERKYESLENIKSNLEKKYITETKTLNKKLVDLEGRLEMTTLVNKESEQKNKILSFQINEYKHETKILSKKVLELKSNLKEIKQLYKEKEEENKKLISQLHELKVNSSRSYNSVDESYKEKDQVENDIEANDNDIVNSDGQEDQVNELVDN